MARDRGSILLEALIAFAIAAMALAILLSQALTALRATRVAGGYEEALARARSHLSALDSRVRALVPGEAHGDDGSGFRWSTRVNPMASTMLAGDNAAATGGATAARETLFAVSATIDWVEDGRPHHVTLRTMRLGSEVAR